MRFHPHGPVSPVPLLQKRQLGSKCSLSRCPKSAPRPLRPARTGNSPPAIAASSAPASLPGPIGSQIPSAVRPPLRAANLPRWCTQSAKLSPPWQIVLSARAPTPSEPQSSLVPQGPAQSSCPKTLSCLFRLRAVLGLQLVAPATQGSQR